MGGIVNEKYAPVFTFWARFWQTYPLISACLNFHECRASQEGPIGAAPYKWALVTLVFIHFSYTWHMPHLGLQGQTSSDEYLMPHDASKKNEHSTS